MDNYSSLSDSALDTAYETAWKAAQIATGPARAPLAAAYTGMAVEMLDRLGGVWSFATGVFGHTRFPKFDAIHKATGGFSQVADSQGAVVADIKGKADSLVSGLKFGATAIGGLGLIALLLFFRGRK
jgi:hypothetical protein